MAPPDERYFDRALARISKSMLWLGIAGVVAASVWSGWRGGAGFALGTVASWLNFRWLKNVVDVLGSRTPTRKRVAILAGLRYVILGAGAYVILRYSSISVPATLAGLFVPVAAVIIEILFELVYASN